MVYYLVLAFGMIMYATVIHYKPYLHKTMPCYVEHYNSMSLKQRIIAERIYMSILSIINGWRSLTYFDIHMYANPASSRYVIPLLIPFQADMWDVSSTWRESPLSIRYWIGVRNIEILMLMWIKLRKTEYIYCTAIWLNPVARLVLDYLQI